MTLAEQTEAIRASLYFQEALERVKTRFSGEKSELYLGLLNSIVSARKAVLHDNTLYEIVVYSNVYDSNVTLTFSAPEQVMRQGSFNTQLWDSTGGLTMPTLKPDEWRIITEFLGQLFAANTDTVETVEDWVTSVFTAWLTGHHQPRLQWCGESTEKLADVLQEVTTVTKSATYKRNAMLTIENVTCIEYRKRFHIIMPNWVRELRANQIIFEEKVLKRAMRGLEWDSQYVLAARTDTETLLKKVWRSPEGFCLPALPGSRMD